MHVSYDKMLKQFGLNWMYIKVRGLYITATQSFVFDFTESRVRYIQITTSI